jgi:hypothetical protein
MPTNSETAEKYTDPGRELRVQQRARDARSFDKVAGELPPKPKPKQTLTESLAKPTTSKPKHGKGGLA